MTLQGIGYTILDMRYRIPPAVAWLVKTRQHADGRLKIAERDLLRMQANESAMVEALKRTTALTTRLRADVKSLDDAIRMHEIGIDPETIGSVHVKRVSIAKANAKDSFTRSIFACVGNNASEWKTTTEIASFVANRCHPDLLTSEFPLYRQQVIKRIQALVVAGKLERLAGRTGNQEGRYRLADRDPSKHLTDVDVQQLGTGSAIDAAEVGNGLAAQAAANGGRFSRALANAKPSVIDAVLRCVSRDSSWKTTTEIVAFVTRECRPGLLDVDTIAFRHQVRNQIQTLVRRRTLERLERRTGNEEGRYRLAK